MTGITPIDLRAPGIDMRVQLAPWDRPYFPGNTAILDRIAITDPARAEAGFDTLRAWCAAEDVVLVVARHAQDRLAETGFLEAHGFRFIELNYRPCHREPAAFVADPEIEIATASRAEAPALADMARASFSTGRLHIDPQVGPATSARRYAGWVANAFDTPRQQVLVFYRRGAPVGFFVVEAPAAHARFWSLTAVAPGLTGQGLGTRLWRTMLARHAAEGVREVTTSISSQNGAAFNLYVSLGFRFPTPDAVLHWCPRGPLPGSPAALAAGMPA